MCFIVALDHLCRAVGHHHHTLSEQEKTVWDRETTNKKYGWKVNFSDVKVWRKLMRAVKLQYILIRSDTSYNWNSCAIRVWHCKKGNQDYTVALWQMDKCKKTPQQIRMDVKNLRKPSARMLRQATATFRTKFSQQPQVTATQLICSRHALNARCWIHGKNIKSSEELCNAFVEGRNFVLHCFHPNLVLFFHELWCKERL